MSGRWRVLVRAATLGAAILMGTAVSAQTPVVEYYHLDALGSVRAVTNAAGAVVSRHEYEPFGEEWQPVVPPTTARQFTGKERDPETGLDYFGARYFRADLGQFTAVDPALDLKQALVEPQRWNRDACVTNNPLRYIDPDGRDRMGMYEPGQRGTATPWRGLWTEVTAIGAVAAAVVAPFFAPEVASAAVGCFLSPACQQNALDVMAPDGAPSMASGTRLAGRAYETAVAGGAHAGALRNMTGRSLGEVEKAIRGYERQVAEHMDKIANPTRHIGDWAEMTSVQRNGLLSKWKRDLERNRDLADVMRGLVESMR